MSSNKKWTKSDFFIIGILFALLVGWGPLWTIVIAPRFFPAAKTPPPSTLTNQVASLSGAPTELKAASPEAEAPAAAVTGTPAAAPVAPPAAPAAAVQEAPVADATLVAARRDPANLAVLSNSMVRIGVSRLGGGIAFTELLKYPVSPDNPQPLMLDFASEPALALIPTAAGAGSKGWEAFAADRPFEIQVTQDGRTATLTTSAEDGLTLERVLTLSEDYRLTVEDRFINKGTAAVALPEYGLQAGTLFFPPEKSGGSQGTYLGIDTLSSTGGEDVRHWGSSSFFSRKEQLTDFFLPMERRGGGCAMNKPALSQPLPGAIRYPVADRTDWLAVKNKFFTQILVPEGGSAGFILGAQRVVPPQEKSNLPSSWSTAPLIMGVSAVLTLDPVVANPGETVSRKVLYYAGPKEYSRLEPMGNRMVEVM